MNKYSSYLLPNGQKVIVEDVYLLSEDFDIKKEIIQYIPADYKFQEITNYE